VGLAALRKWGTRISKEDEGEKLYYMRQAPPLAGLPIDGGAAAPNCGWALVGFLPLQRQQELLDSLRRNQGYAMRCAAYFEICVCIPRYLGLIRRSSRGSTLEASAVLETRTSRMEKRAKWGWVGLVWFGR
jgi:hypothetical protein